MDRFSREARVAHEFGFWPGRNGPDGIPGDALLALDGWAVRFKAQRVLEQIGLSGRKLKAESLHDFVLKATGSKEEAERAMTDQINDDLRNDRKPE